MEFDYTSVRRLRITVLSIVMPRLLKQESPCDMLMPDLVNEYGNVFLYCTTSTSAQDEPSPRFYSLYEICL